MSRSSIANYLKICNSLQDDDVMPDCDDDKDCGGDDMMINDGNKDDGW